MPSEQKQNCLKLGHLHGVGGAVGKAPNRIIGAVGVLERCCECDPPGEVAVAGDGEGSLERADAFR